MKQVCNITIILLGLFVSSNLWAQSYDGQWERVSVQLMVSVESWGDNCGPMPKSFYNRKKKNVDVLQNSGHLFFSTGGLRTDKCNSVNPSLKVISSTAIPGNWSRMCETSRSEPKYEKIDYTLKASDANRLIYIAKSKANWTLSNDHCVVNWTEKRVYVRPGASSGDSSSTRSGGSPVLRVHTAGDEGSEGTTEDKNGKRDCGDKGEVEKLIIFPQDQLVTPGEKLCFQVRGQDAAGCRFPVNARWSVTGKGGDVGHLITRGGCFATEKNGSDAVGRFNVRASAGGVVARTTVSVEFPDVGDLARVRIDLEPPPSEAPVEAASSPQTGEEQQSVVQAVDTSVGHSSGAAKLWIIAGIAILLLAGGGAFFFVKKTRGGVQDFDTREFEDAGKSMICPVCNRGYDEGARFCPHDSSRLLPLDDWKSGARSG